jgi:hypothetical protein
MKNIKGIFGLGMLASLGAKLLFAEPLSFLVADEGGGAIHRVTPGNAGLTWTIPLAGNRDMQLIGGNRLLANHPGGFREYDLTTGAQLKSTAYTAIGTVHSMRRLKDGRTVVAGNGSNSVEIAFLSPSGQEQKRLSIPMSGPTLRMIRFTEEGRILFGSGNRVYECDSTGKILRNIPITSATGGQITAYKVIQRGDGTLWATTGYAKSLVEISATGAIKAIVADGSAASNFYGDFQILPNGHFLMNDWWGHGPGNGSKGPMLREFDAAGKVVWKYQDAALISSAHGLIVLDGLDLKVLHDDFTGVQTPIGTTTLLSNLPDIKGRHSEKERFYNLLGQNQRGPKKNRGLLRIGR